jgi:Swi5-dependent recombination DNA repair protein 1
MYSHAAKRRRIEAASYTLSKPFRSPFKGATKSQVDRECTASPNTPGPDEKQQTRPPANGRIQFSPSIAQTPEFRHRSRVDFSNEPTLYSLLKEERHLERELRELKSELDTIEQARKIETKEKDDELVGLIEKWKGAARMAAEEVFGRVSDRVNRYE